MKHFGIFFNCSERWLTNDSGMVFWTTCNEVAKEQLKILKEARPNAEAIVKEFANETTVKKPQSR